jgi:hypothetical protein
VVRSPKAPHSDELRVAVEHFNAEFRHRYRLPSTSLANIQQAIGFEEVWAGIQAIRAEGVADASCAVIAKGVLSIVPSMRLG